MEKMKRKVAKNNRRMEQAAEGNCGGFKKRLEYQLHRIK